MGEGVALIGGRAVVGYGAGVVRFYAEVVFVHVAQLVLRGSETLVGGLPVPDQGLGVVLRDTAAAEIVIAESELGLGVAGGGLLLQGVEIVGLRGCGRSGFLDLRARGGNRREGEES